LQRLSTALTLTVFSVVKKLRALLQGRRADAMREAKAHVQITYCNAGKESSVGKFIYSVENSHFPLPKIISYSA